MIQLFAALLSISAFAADPQWKPVPGAVPMQAITFASDGSTYAITPAGTLVSRARGATAWVPELGRAHVKFVAAQKDGSVLALDAAIPKIYSKAGGVWSIYDGFAEQMLRTINGASFARFADGTVSNSQGPQFAAKFRYISLPSQADGIFLAGMDDKLYWYGVGTAAPTEIVGKGKGRMLVGTGKGTRGSMFALGAGLDALAYFFEVTPMNKWVPITGGPGMKFLAMQGSKLYGITLNNELYALDAIF